MVLVVNSESELQSMLNVMYQWCKKWCLKLNSNKTKIVHFRGKRVKQTTFKFTYGSKAIDIVHCYKYLSVIFDEFVSYDECSKTLSESAGQALSALISKFKDTGYETFTNFLTLVYSRF